MIFKYVAWVAWLVLKRDYGGVSCEFLGDVHVLFVSTCSNKQLSRQSWTNMWQPTRKPKSFLATCKNMFVY